MVRRKNEGGPICPRLLYTFFNVTALDMGKTFEDQNGTFLFKLIKERLD